MKGAIGLISISVFLGCQEDAGSDLTAEAGMPGPDAAVTVDADRPLPDGEPPDASLSDGLVADASPPDGPQDAEACLETMHRVDGACVCDTASRVASASG